MKRLIIALACVATMSCGQKSDTTQVEKTTTEKTAKPTISELQNEANKGNLKAQYELGLAYINGNGVPIDDSKGLAWIKKSAENGHAAAQLWIGIATAEMKDTDPKYIEISVSWITMAAQNGHPDAQHLLGLDYLTGEGGVPRDPAVAVHWFRKAAEQGVLDAQYWLSRAYATGTGVTKDLSMAANLARYSAEQGHAESQLWLSAIYARGDGFPKDMVLSYAWANLAAAKGQDKGFRNVLEDSLTTEEIKEAQLISSNWRVGKPIFRMR